MASATVSSSSARGRRSLRWRIALTVAVTTLLVILAQALAFVELLEEEEEDLIDELLNRQIVHAIDATHAQMPPSLPAAMVFFPVQRDAPPEVRALPIGNHEIFRDGEELHVAVRESAGERSALVFDVADHEARLQTLTAMTFAGAVGIALVTLLVVYVVAGQLTYDLRALADAVEAQPADAALQLDVRATSLSAEVAVVAEALDRARTRYRQALAREREVTANLSHELRTPLTAIRTDAELLGELPDLPEAARRRGAAIVEQCDRIAALTSGLLTLAREMRAGPAEWVALRGTIEAAWARLAPVGRLALDVPETARVRVDPALLDIVIGNLLANAVRHGAGRVSCELAGTVLTVVDDGPGVAEAALSRLFVRRHRGADSAGFGLGLALVAEACTACGWEFSAGNRPGHGLAVSIRLTDAADA